VTGDMNTTDVGLLAIRTVVGLLIVGHGLGNLFGWLGGFGLDDTGEAFERLGFRSGRLLTGMTGGFEIVTGVLLALGWLTPLATAAMIGLMVTTIFTAHAGRGPWFFNGGWQHDLTLLTVAIALGFIGPGRVAADAALGWHLWGWGWGSTALGAGVVAGLLSLALRRGGPPSLTGGAVSPSPSETWAGIPPRLR
jgi:putative oxidoreductase